MNTILKFSMIWGEESLPATRQGKAKQSKAVHQGKASSVGTGYNRQLICVLNRGIMVFMQQISPLKQTE